MESQTQRIDKQHRAVAEPVGVVNKLLMHSFVDGPGNRAVVFLQGCNLRCRFCHNPQTLSLCNHCGDCVPVCPSGALSIQDAQVVWDADQCRECDACVKTCSYFSSPRVLHYSPSALWTEIAPYAPFLAGVTVSGGEPLLQLDFVLDFFTAVKAHSTLTTFIETNGVIAPNQLARLLPLLDGALVDLKVFDSEAHRSLTGSGNEITRETIRTLAKQGKLYAVRQTVIPGINDDLKNGVNMARFLAEIDPNIRLRFLRFRPHGTRGEAQHWDSPDDGTMKDLVEAACSQGLKTVDYFM